MTLILREILQTASSVNEAEAILKNRRGSVSENVLVMDADGGEAVVFEVTPKRIDRLTVEKSLGVANHFRSPVFKDDQTNFTRQQENTTARRQARMDELLATHDGAITLDTSANILSDRAGLGDQPLAPGHRWAIDADIATHSVVIDATSRTIWVSRYPNIAGGYVSFSLEKGLSGDIQGTEVRPPEKLTRTFNVHRSRQLLSESSDRSAIERDQAARRALTLAPEHPAALKRLAEALVDQDRHLEAKPIIKRALAAQPEFAHEKRELLTLEQAVR
jgi:hypothetical protein